MKMMRIMRCLLCQWRGPKRGNYAEDRVKCPTTAIKRARARHQKQHGKHALLDVPADVAKPISCCCTFSSRSRRLAVCQISVLDSFAVTSRPRSSKLISSRSQSHVVAVYCGSRPRDAGVRSERSCRSTDPSKNSGSPTRSCLRRRFVLKLVLLSTVRNSFSFELSLFPSPRIFSPSQPWLALDQYLGFPRSSAARAGAHGPLAASSAWRSILRYEQVTPTSRYP